MSIKKMSIEEKIALLSETDKAYVKGYIDRALLETGIDNGKTEDYDESELEYEHMEGRYEGEV